jgi:hypothetical protein
MIYTIPLNYFQKKKEKTGKKEKRKPTQKAACMFCQGFWEIVFDIYFFKLAKEFSKTRRAWP